MYHAHQVVTPEYQHLIDIATSHCKGVIPYSVSRRVIDHLKDFGMHLTSQQFYNLVRKRRPKVKDNIIKPLLLSLDEAGFRCHCRVKRTYKYGEIVNIKLVQLFFAH